VDLTGSRLLLDAGADWAADLDRVFSRPDDLRLVFQPIVDVAQGRIAGYETLARFLDADGAPSTRPPDQWFAAADARGLGARLEAVVLERCIRLREDLPANCFLTVNVSPHLITSPELADPLLAAGDLSGLVIEFTEHETVPNLKPLLDMREVILDRGALVALDDAGSGYSGLQQITSFRPQMIKLDRALVAGIDHDEVKLALAEMLGEFGGRIDAWLLAEGVETWGEMEAFLRLGVPLAQGWLLGRPGPPWVQLDAGVAARLRQQYARTGLAEEVVSLVEQVPLLDEGRVPAADRIGVEVDRYRRRRAFPTWPSGSRPDRRSAGSTRSCASTTSAPSPASSGWSASSSGSPSGAPATEAEQDAPLPGSNRCRGRRCNGAAGGATVSVSAHRRRDPTGG